MFLFRASSGVLAVRCHRFIGSMNTCCKCLFLAILNVVLYIVLNQSVLTNIQSSIHSSLSRGRTNPKILTTKVKLNCKILKKIQQNNFRKTLLSWWHSGCLKSNKSVINYLVLKREKNNQTIYMKMYTIRECLIKQDHELFLFCWKDGGNYQKIPSLF